MTVAIIGLLATLAAAAVPSIIERANRADALTKTRSMGTAVLQYTADHGGLLPPLFPGQVLEYENGRGGRIVTECATYLGIEARPGKYLVQSLMPRAYARVREPSDHAQMRVWVMNTALTNNHHPTINPFGRVTTPGQPPTGNLPLAALAGAGAQWMISTADQRQPNVATAPWRANTPAESPLGDMRAVLHFDGSAGMVRTNKP